MTGSHDTPTTPADDLAWIPAEACELPAADRPARVTAFADLFAATVLGVERVAATRLRLLLSFTPATAARVAALAVREAECCGFFTFTLTATAGELVLDASVPPQWSAVLDAMAEQASAT